MDRKHSQPGSKRLSRPSRARHGKLSDDELDTIAMAFGSHLIRNSPPRASPSVPAHDWKLGNK